MDISPAKFIFPSQIKKVVLLETFLKLRIRSLISTQLTSLFTISQDWPHITVIKAPFFVLAERISVKKRKYMPSSHFSFLISSSLPPFMFPLPQRKCRSIFHLLHGLGCDQKFQFIVGREYSYAFPTSVFFSLPKRNCNVSMLCVQKTKQSEYYSHML